MYSNMYTADVHQRLTSVVYSQRVLSCSMKVFLCSLNHCCSDMSVYSHCGSLCSTSLNDDSKYCLNVHSHVQTAQASPQHPFSRMGFDSSHIAHLPQCEDSAVPYLIWIYVGLLNPFPRGHSASRETIHWAGLAGNPFYPQRSIVKSYSATYCKDRFWSTSSRN